MRAPHWGLTSARSPPRAVSLGAGPVPSNTIHADRAASPCSDLRRNFVLRKPKNEDALCWNVIIREEMLPEGSRAVDRHIATDRRAVPIFGCMVRIAITSAAFEAIAATLPGSINVENQRATNGDFHI